ncbi:hypothetical protein [Nocardia sp. NPDC048505]|uniref:RskA family anti-sigma factor n=1 Tax=unclassified Nocardia TaxID=2637762 RepID=UPI0033D2090E
MTSAGRPDAELLELAYPYALDAVPPAERCAVESRRRCADAVTAAEFDATVAALRDTLAALSLLDVCAPPGELEARLVRALDLLWNSRMVIQTLQ